MKALVVYESMFGNTEEIAREVAAGMAPVADVTLADVSTVPNAAGMDLVVVGGPTHAFGMSRPASREDAARRGEVRPGAVDVGVREWLDLASPLPGVAAAAFCSRVDKGFIAGSAATKVQRRLRRLGCRMIAAPEGFVVTGTAGPLADGEKERAQRWGAAVAEAASASVQRV